MEIMLDLGSADTRLNVVVTGRLDVHNAAAFQQLMSHLHMAGGSGMTCDVSRTDIADAAARSAVDSVRHNTEEYGGSLVSAPRDEGGTAAAAVPPPAVTTSSS